MIGTWERQDNKTQYIFMTDGNVVIFPVKQPSVTMKYSIIQDRDFPRLVIGDKSFLMIAPSDNFFALATKKGIIDFKRI